MTFPGLLMDQSAIQRLLAQMGRPSVDTPQAPNMGGLLNPQLPAPVPFNPNAQAAAHEHQGGLLGGVKHLLGSDRISPELAGLLTPDQQRRVKPGILRSLYGYAVEGRGPEAIAQERAANLKGMELKLGREKQRAQILAAFPPPKDPNALPEWTSQVASIAAAAPVPDPEWAKELATTYSAVRERPVATAGLREVRDIPRDGKLYQQLVSPDGKVVYEVEQAPKSVSAFGSGSEANMVMRLRTDYRLQPAIKNARTIETAFNRIQNTQDNAVGDLSLIFAYMKMLDPESVVRETEFANAQNTAGVPDQIRNLYNRVREGVRLTPEQRRQFREQAKRLADGAREGADKANAEYRLLAETFGIDPKLIFTESERSPSSPARPGGLPNTPPPRP